MMVGDEVLIELIAATASVATVWITQNNAAGRRQRHDEETE